MQNKHQRIVAALGAILLSACGGGGGAGGGDGGGANLKPSTPVPTVSSSATISGGGYRGVEGSPSSFTIEAGDNKNLLKVDGRVIELVPSGITGNFYRAENATGRRLVGLHLSYARYGSLFLDQPGLIYEFAQGEATPLAQVPSTGQANYVGGAVFSQDDNLADGRATFVVNFGTKQLDGKLNFNAPWLFSQWSQILIKATITGNTFSGTYHDSAANNTTSAQGGFYGPNAAELAGTYIDASPEPAFGGAFGAKKQ